MPAASFVVAESLGAKLVEIISLALMNWQPTTRAKSQLLAVASLLILRPIQILRPRISRTAA